MSSVRYYTRRPYRPVDHRALAAGVRDVIKMEDAGPGLQRLAARLLGSRARQEIVVRRKRAGRADIYLSRVPGLARRLYEVESDPHACAEEAGRLLGYPPCCVDAFVRSGLPGGKDWAHFQRALRATRTTPKALANPLSDSSLVPFHPCRLDCERAVQFAKRILRAQPVKVRKDLVRVLRSPILVWSAFDIVVFQGRFRGLELAYTSFAWNTGAPDHAIRRLLQPALQRGKTVHVEGSTVVVSKGRTKIAEVVLAPARPRLVRWS